MVWWTFQSVVMAALLAGFVQFLCRTCPIGPVGRHALWLVVLLKLVTPPLVAWPWAVHDPLTRILKPRALEQIKAVADVPATVGPTVILQPPRDDTMDADAPSATDMEIVGTADSPAPLPSAHSPAVPTAACAVAPSQATSLPARWSPASLLPIACGLWIAGGVLFALVQLVRMVRMALLLRHSTSADKTLADCAGKLASRLGMRPVRIRIVPGIVSPMIWAIIKPEILWPAKLPSGMAESSVHGLIVHELAHVKRRDHWVGWLELLTGCVWWWNPLFWYVRHQLRENAELACDAWVVQTLPSNRRGYAEALVAVCESMCDRLTIHTKAPVAPMPALGIGTGGRRFMERRLVMILRDQVALRLPRLVMLAVSVLSLAALPAWSQKATEEAAGKEAISDTVDRMVVRRADPNRADYLSGNSAPLPAEAQSLIERSNELQREMARKLNEQRAQLIQQLKELQDKYTKAGQLDEAVAVRDRIRQFEGGRLGDRTRRLEGTQLTPRDGAIRLSNVRPDPGTLSQFRDQVGESFNFEVTGSTEGSVWGDGRYTDDSALAAAAVHVGILQPGQHGVVRVTMLAGRDHYEGSTRNGVTSAPYGPWPGSYCIDPVRASIRWRYRAAPPAADPGRLSDYRDRVGQSLLFTTTGSEDGTIWGDGVYTDDSPLAVAAVHAGILKVGQQGVVRVTIVPGQDSYGGSTQNGITSQPYGSFPGSYRVERRDADGPLLSWTLPKPMASPGINLFDFRGKAGQTIVLEITGSTEGSVWGTDVYTDDSSIPAAAVHAGVLKDGEKGIVQITTLPGQESYNPSNRNGVESGAWGHWDGSFRIQRHGEPAGDILRLRYDKVRKLYDEKRSGGDEPALPAPEKVDVERF